MTNDNKNYERRVNDILSLHSKLKENIMQKDYSKEDIILIWKEWLNT